MHLSCKGLLTLAKFAGRGIGDILM